MSQNPGQESSLDDVLIALDTVGLADSNDVRINPATSDNQTDGSQLTQVADIHGDPVTVQHPFPTDGDSVYDKDIKDSLSDVGTFTDADLLTLFNNLDDSIVDSDVTNPKWFKFFLERPITTGSIGIVAKTGNFSNVHIEFFDRQGTLLAENDDSSNNSKYTAHGYQLTATNVCCIKMSFHTADTVTVSFLRIPKDITTVSRMKALKPNGTEVEIGATAGGNLKQSLEEFDDSFLTTPLPVTKGFNIPIYDYMALTYVSAGNGAGEIETVIYKTGGSGGSTVATLTLTYNADDEIATVTQT